MDDSAEIVLKNICCTCLSKDRKLYQLCRLIDGVNNLYLLLSHDSEAYREGFYKDTFSLFICWECRAVMCRITRFRQQACAAQRLLTSIADGRTNINSQLCLSRLSTHHISEYNTIILETDTVSDNFIDCGPYADVKSETEEDIPLSELHNNWTSDNGEPDLQDLEFNVKKVKQKRNKTCKKDKLYFTSTRLNEDELKEVRMNKKLTVEFVDSIFKCDSCIECFKSEGSLEEHNLSLHKEKPNHRQCDICLVYTKKSTYNEHREHHYQKHCCLCCEFVSYDVSIMITHLQNSHAVKTSNIYTKRKKGLKKLSDRKPGSKVHQNSIVDKKTSFGYLCKECNRCFENKKQRWNHVQRFHREGHKCPTCGKKFPFKNNLARHEQLHQGPPPRTECEVCHKMVRVDMLKVHSRIHSEREQYTCVECSKTFVSRASYEHHLKYTQAHAVTDILKYKCSRCDKGYRSQGELRDHVNYQHMGKTQHKCPICGKALATRRCITRHVRRAHDGVKESVRDKICQQCGKAFRDKKGLREHELIHTGERPLSCEICGCTFRQSASLYTHRKRVHKIYPPAKSIELLT